MLQQAMNNVQIIHLTPKSCFWDKYTQHKLLSRQGTSRKRVVTIGMHVTIGIVVTKRSFFFSIKLPSDETRTWLTRISSPGGVNVNTFITAIECIEQKNNADNQPLRLEMSDIHASFYFVVSYVL